jgi:uncharacterized membrane protein
MGLQEMKLTKQSLKVVWLIVLNIVVVRMAFFFVVSGSWVVHGNPGV